MFFSKLFLKLVEKTSEIKNSFRDVVKDIVRLHFLQMSKNLCNLILLNKSI